jgi:hypothetical protein
MIELNLPNSQKVAVHFGSRTIKGYLESPSWNTIEEFLVNTPQAPRETIQVRRLESDIVEEISIRDVKAIFYVNSFRGDSNHKELIFYSRAPIVHGIWMRVQFLDGEIIEGIVYNSLRYLVDPGFFLFPTDPDGNNKLVYVVKSWLADHRILGVRKLTVPVTLRIPVDAGR